MLDQNGPNIIMIKFKEENLDWSLYITQVGCENKLRPDPCSIHLNTQQS